ncbi:hypothetical protein HK107_00925 [Parvularcula sp. ZS-1/3]|uniref:Uncharacterized protein n=1 Tax=Parvularcula mediterranea TaxID=2732508 RepID=A0A7Y3RIU7_9PROT|nr:hypothetical protein [Parvularcula mediterranea]NNU14884.1 hypothetical protein [Parvularcula mediterranea]
MVRVLAFIGTFAIGFFVVTALKIGLFAFTAVNQEEEGAKYARYVLETYGESWDPGFIRAEAGRELAMQNADFESIAVAFTQAFGTIETVDTFECPAWQQLQEGPRMVFVLACRASARSTKGQLDVEVHVIKRDEWKTNVIWVHGIVPRTEDPFRQSVSAGITLASAKLGEPTVPCDAGVQVGLNGLTVSRGCMQKSESHSVR